MQPSMEADLSRSTPSTCGGLFVPPRVLSPRVLNHGYTSELSTKPTLLYGLPISFRDRTIQSNDESECTSQRGSTPIPVQGELDNMNSKYCTDVNGSLLLCNPTFNVSKPEKLNASAPKETNDLYSQCSSNDADFADVPLREANEVSDQVDSVHGIASLSPCSPRNIFTADQSTESTGLGHMSNSCKKEIGCSFVHSVNEFSDSKQLRIEVNLPSVEDGLSSGSEPDALSSDYYYRSPLCSGSDSRHRIQDSCSRSTTHSPLHSPIQPVIIDESLVNPPLVRDILGIMRDIKLVLTDETATTRAEDLASQLGKEGNHKNEKKEHCPVSDARHSLPDKSPTTYLQDQSNNVFRTRSAANAITSVYGSGVSTAGNCSRMIVRASVEHSVDLPTSNGSSKWRKETPSRLPHEVQLASTSTSNTDRHARQWNFPHTPNVVYSSSDDEIAPVNPSPSKPIVRSRLPSPPPPPQQLAPVTNHESRYSNHMTTRESGKEDTDKLLTQISEPDKPIYIPELRDEAARQVQRQQHVREVSIRHPNFQDQLIHGVLFHARYLGSTQLVSQRQPSRSSRLYQAKEAVLRVKDPDDEDQPSVPVELFISVDRIMILNNTLQEILIDHCLRTVSYIADMGDVLVLMARRLHPSEEHVLSRSPTESDSTSTRCPSSSSTSTPSSTGKHSSPTKLICHVLESDEAQLVAQSVDHAFQLAYLNYLRENGIDDLSMVKHLNHEDTLNEKEIFCDELALFSDKRKQKQITIPKQSGEALGVVIVSSGWGSLLPTALLANMLPAGPAARCGQLNIGNRIIAVNGHSLVGLPLPECQHLIKACRSQSSVQLTVVDCSPVTEVCIRRPSIDYQLGFSVQDGVICSLLRGGIAERGGIRVDHRIIEINDESVVAVPHEYIVQLLKLATGEIQIRTMPTAVFRLLTGQDTPNYI